jgi:hypothetical protein
MPGRVSQLEHVAAISRVAHLGSHAEAFREHLGEIIASQAFKGSRRSQDFLRHIVHKALDGRCDELKERALGVELFGRPAGYDTGEDAIVRVTASDVRKRLLHFYAVSGPNAGLRIDLPSGSYIAEFRDLEKSEDSLVPAEAPEPVQQTPHPAEEIHSTPKRPRIANFMFFGLGALCVCLTMTIWQYRASAAPFSPTNVEPWLALFRPDRQVRLVFCDPDISKLQGLLDFRISLSDYANGQYLPPGIAIGPDLQRAIQTMRGVDVAAVDATIALNISELALNRLHRMKTDTARSIHLMDFKTNDTFILLGSPRSNPWFHLFEDQLDFRFEYDKALRQEIVVNRAMRSGEAGRYVPTAQGWDTGQAYAVVALVNNPGQSGQVLLLAGSNAEATEAAGKLVTNLDPLSRVLKDQGVDVRGPAQEFEILLKVASMAGSSNTFEVIACHRLRAVS